MTAVVERTGEGVPVLLAVEPQLRRDIARSTGLSGADLDDAVADVMVAALDGAVRFESKDHALSWALS